MAVRYDDMTRAELLAEVRALQGLLGHDAGLQSLVQELNTRDEEIRAQQVQIAEAQHALEASRDRYADLFDFAPIGYATLDTTGVIREINLTAASLIGVERGRLIGFPLLVHVERDDRRTFLNHLARCRQKEIRPTCRVRLRSRAGRVVPVELVSGRVGSGESAQLLHTAIVDMTDHEKAEEERRRSEEERERLRREEQALRAASEAKDRFLAVLSHELRTPLTPILFSLSALDARGGVPDELRPVVEMVRRNAELEARLIDDLLDTTRIARGKLHMHLEIVDLHAAAGDVLRMCQAEIEAAQLTAWHRCEAPEHHVRADATRLRQVIWNLVKNAIRYTPAGGCIGMTTWNARPGKVCLAVQDTGVGIDAAIRPRLFRPFEQGADASHRAGLGLGLAISKGIVEALGGAISAYSRGSGEGSRFDIELDAVPPPAEAAVARRGPGVEAEKPAILLVEDHPDSATAIGEALRVHGYEVALADSMATALRFPEGRFDVVISDIGLPDGSGLDLMRQLRESHRVKGIALSGYGSDQDVRRSLEAGFELHLTKPIDVGQLIDAIARVTASPATSTDA